MLVGNLVCDKTKPKTLFCTFWDVSANSWQFICSKNIVSAVKKVVSLAKADTSSFLEDDIESHSLGASGETTMYINRQDAMKIQCAGHWTSNTL